MQSRHRKFSSKIAALLPIVLIAAACGSSGGGTSADTKAPTTVAVTTTAAPTTDVPTTDAPATSDAGSDDTTAPTEETTAPTEETTAPTDAPAAEPEGCSAKTDSIDPQPLAEKTTITLSSAGTIEAFAPLYLAQSEGEFAKENLEVNIVTTQTAVQALATGEVDGAFTAPSIEMINAVNQDVQLKWIAGNYTVTPDTKIGIYARTDVVGATPDYSKLKGQKLAMAGPTGITLLTVNKLLGEQGLSLSDVEIIKLAPADGLIALENGAVGAAWLNAPFNREAIDQPDFQFLGGQGVDVVGGGLVVGEKLLKPENCDITLALMRSLERVVEGSLKPGYHNDTKVVGELAELFQIPADSITSGEELTFTLSIPPTVIDDFQDALVNGGLLEAGARASDDQLVDRAFEEAVSSPS